MHSPLYNFTISQHGEYTEMYSIEIKSLTKHIVSLEGLSPKMTIDNLKQAIHNQTGAHVHLMRLIYKGETLQNTLTLQDAKLNNATLQLFVESRDRQCSLLTPQNRSSLLCHIL